MTTIFAVRSALFALFVALVVNAAGAQTYPVKPVRMVIAFAPGGGTDIVGRIIAQKLSELGPQPIVSTLFLLQE